MASMASPQVASTDRWDPSTPAFLSDISRTMSILLVISVGAALAIAPSSVLGVLSGGILAKVAYALLLRAGKRLSSPGRSRASLGLSSYQPLLWLAVLVLVAAIRVSAIGLAAGVSILPASIFFTLGWYVLQRRASR